MKSRNLIIIADYFDRWRELDAELKVGIRAWEQLERELYAATGLTRYADYNSFLKGKAREIRLRKSKKVFLSLNPPAST